MKAKQSRAETRQGHCEVGPDQVNARRATLPLGLWQLGDRTKDVPKGGGGGRVRSPPCGVEETSNDFNA